jgi:hypothetical protein
MTASEAIRREEMKKLNQLRKTYSAHKGEDRDWDSDMHLMIARLEMKLGIR